MIDIKNDDTLEQLVTGKFSVEELNDAIVQCECEPELWRRVALRFLEQQEMKSALSEFVSSDASTVTSSKSDPDPNYNPRTARPTKPIIIALTVLFAVASGLSYWWGSSSQEQTIADNKFTPQAEPTGSVYLHVTPPAQFVSGPASPTGYEELTHSVVPHESRQLLRKHGFEVYEKMHWDYVQGEDGEYHPVPERNVRLEYVKLQE